MILTPEEQITLCMEVSRAIESVDYDSRELGRILHKIISSIIAQRRYNNVSDEHKEILYCDAVVKVKRYIPRYNYSKYAKAVQKRFGEDRAINHVKGVYAYIDLLIKSSIKDSLLKCYRKKELDAKYVFAFPVSLDDIVDIIDANSNEAIEEMELRIDEYFASKNTRKELK